MPIHRTLLVLGIAIGVVFLLLPDGEPAPTERTRKPNEYEWIKRTFPYFQADPYAYRDAYEALEAMRAPAKASAFGSWELLGPTNIPGRISDIEFDIQRPEIVYAGSATGGVFKSTDGGNTWLPIFDALPSQNIGDIGIDPTDTDIIYVATGEGNGGHNNFVGAGVFKSIDGGGTWDYSGLLLTANTARVLVDPNSPNRVYVAAIGSYFAPGPHRGVYRSVDAGLTWEQSLFVNDSTGIIDLVMRPDDPEILFAAAWERARRVTTARLSGPSSGVYKSADGGDTWERLGAETGLPQQDDVGRIGLALCPSNPDVMLALYNHSATHMGIYKSVDGGTTWAETQGGISAGPFTWYFGQVKFAPHDCGIAFIGDVDLHVTRNGGETWDARVLSHVDYHAFAFKPVSQDVALIGHDGGIDTWSYSQGQNTFTRVARLPNTQFYEIGLDPSDPNRFYGGTQDNGTLRSSGPNDWTPIWGGDGFYVIVHPNQPDRVYAESQFGNLVRITLSTGQYSIATSGISTEEQTNWSTPVAISPQNPEVMYYGTSRLYRTVNGAQLWEAASPSLVRGGYALLGTISAIGPAPSDSTVIYVGTDDGYVWVTSDYASSWTRISGTLPVRWVTRVVVDPFDASVAYVTYSGLKWRDDQPHVFRTRDMGVTWEDISSNLPDAPVNAFAVDPVDAKYLFVGTDIGAFASTDNGGSWDILGDGIPSVSVYDMKIFYDGNDHFLVAGTHGRSMYKLDLKDVITGTDDQTPSLAEPRLREPYPNPFGAEVHLPYSVPEGATVRLEVFDGLGRLVATLLDRTVPTGPRSAVWTPEGVASGTYFARLTVMAGSETETYTKTFVYRR